MSVTYVHHRITAAPRCWQGVAAALTARASALAASGGALYGLWRSQIGRPRDEITAITTWPNGADVTTTESLLTAGLAEIREATSQAMRPTLRPTETTPPTRQGNYAFRWFETPEANWAEFLDLCAQAWPGFEAAYDSQVIGLWRLAQPGPGGGIRSLLLTRRPDLAMWERSKLPEGAAEQQVRDTLNRRYDLCDWTMVHTTTLITAADRADKARWT